MTFEATALLLNYSKDNSLRKTIRSIREQSIPIEIILVDNSPEGGDFDCDLYIRPERNLHCKARFLAGCYARSNYLFTLDDDVILNSRDAIEHYLRFLKKFDHREKCICGWHHYSQDPIFFDGWASVDFLKGRFMLFPKSYLNKVSIGYTDLVDPKTGNETTGYNESYENWIGVDDLAFQLNAEYVLIPDLVNPPIKDQKSASVGLFRKPEHFRVRRDFRGKYKNQIRRRDIRTKQVPDTSSP